MKRFVLILPMLSSIALASCSPAPPVVTAVDLGCTWTSRYHTTDQQVAAEKADPGTWYPLFQWLASFDIERDKRCK
jgi:hypothetical protein